MYTQLTDVGATIGKTVSRIVHWGDAPVLICFTDHSFFPIKASFEHDCLFVDVGTDCCNKPVYIDWLEYRPEVLISAGVLSREEIDAFIYKRNTR